jgi:HTH-type transcriptional regulator/antitoxin HigA
MPNTTRRSGNMIAAANIDARKYGRLLARTLPVAIDTPDEHRHMLAEVDKLFDKDLSPEEAKLFDLMVTLIEDYEDKHFQLSAATPLTILLELMENRGVKPRDLWDVIGSKSRVSEILSGQRKISTAQAKKLAEYFKVSADLFI